MKKIIASAVGLMMVGGVAVTTASAVENQFGGYWRTRVFSQTDFDGTDSGSYARADNRTRIYYTAKFSDDFKFVNKLEWNSNWGDTNGGDVGADGMGHIRVKNSYANFNMGPVNAVVGIQGAVVARGFIFDDDFSGAVVTGNFGTVSATGAFISIASEDAGGASDSYIGAAIVPVTISDAVKVTPYYVYHKTGIAEGDANMYLGVDADMSLDAVSLWGSFIYNMGEVTPGQDNAGFLLAGGVTAGVVHGQIVYATGDDDPTDGDNNAFVAAPGSYYAHAEIMGDGIFDNQISNGAPGVKMTNVLLANAGVTIKPMDKLTLNADLWYAANAKENAAGDDQVGTELDLKLTYGLMDNLNLDVVGAYLFAGDVTGDEDPYEVGARLSLSF